MTSVSLKITGASGQGINAIGEVLAKALKRAGSCVFGYREYPSLIKGGHASYQLDVSAEPIGSSETTVDLLLCLNHHGLQKNLRDLKRGAIVLHATPGWKFPPADEALLKEREVTVLYFPVEDILAKLGAKPILGNVLFSALAWSILGGSKEQMKEEVAERFAKKKDLLELNMRCIDQGYAFADAQAGLKRLALPPAKDAWKNHLLLTGSHAMGMGLIHAGARFFAGYPMTPASPLLSYVASLQNRSGMVIKQAEDEITAAQMASGAAMMGTRAFTATSGGGFDLMTETLSLNGLLENPVVFILAQRPGPATGLPTWTTQGDLLLAVGAAHGEFPRCVMAVSDAGDSFTLMPEAFNLAEEYQTPVIVLTDKHIAESLYTQSPYDTKATRFTRGKLVTDPAELATLTSADRYDPSPADGVSKRWNPGAMAAVYCAQGDEHTPDGTSDDSAENAVQQMDKRMRKMHALESALPEPRLFTPANGSLIESLDDPALDLLIVTWGSTRTVVEDVVRDASLAGKRIGILHYTFLWPLKTARFERLAASAKTVVAIEGNMQAQLAMLLRMQCGVRIPAAIVRYDGRPFYRDEVLGQIQQFLALAPKAQTATAGSILRAS